MEKKIFAIGALLALSINASAQYGDSYDKANEDWDPFLEYARSHRKSTANYKGWNTFWVEFNPTMIKHDEKGVDDESATGFAVGYSTALSIAPSMPVFLELGIGLQYTYNTSDDFVIINYDKNGNIIGSYKPSDAEMKTSLISAKVPVNLYYAFQFPNSSISILPNIGANLRYNISGKQKYSFEGDYSWDDDDLEKDVFDKKDMGSSKNVWNRFLIGWSVGLKARFNDQFVVGISYGNDFSELVKKTTIQTTSISIGYTF